MNIGVRYMAGMVMIVLVVGDHYAQVLQWRNQQQRSSLLKRRSSEPLLAQNKKRMVRTLFDEACKDLKKQAKEEAKTLHQPYIEDETAKCDIGIKNTKGDCGLQLETLLESWNEANPRRNLQESPDKSACQSNKRVKPSEPPLPFPNSMCQTLKHICLEQKWALPSYWVLRSDGGFKAEFLIKGTPFAQPICGEENYEADEARESAAACLVAKIHDFSHDSESNS